LSDTTCQCGEVKEAWLTLCPKCVEAKEVAYQVCRALDMNDPDSVALARDAALAYRCGVRIPIRPVVPDDSIRKIEAMVEAAGRLLDKKQVYCEHPHPVTYTAGDPFEECQYCGAFKMLSDGVWRYKT
jgi:hypothetical protein